MASYLEDLKNLKISSSDDEILSFAQKIPQRSELTSDEKRLFLDYAMRLLNLKEQKKLLEDQNKASAALVSKAQSSAEAAWAIVVVTIIFQLLIK